MVHRTSEPIPLFRTRVCDTNGFMIRKMMDCMRNQQIFSDANAFYDLENDGLYADSATILRRKRVL